MKKRQLAALSALILTVSIIFCGCNFDFEIGGKEKTSETALSDVSASGEDVGGEDVTIIENVTDEEGKVISSEAKVLENDEVKDGKDFYDIGEKKELVVAIAREQIDKLLQRPLRGDAARDVQEIGAVREHQSIRKSSRVFRNGTRSSGYATPKRGSVSITSFR